MDAAAYALSHWTQERIDEQCRPSYRRYERELKAHYSEYFRRHPQLRCSRHVYSAGTVAAALPPGYSSLEKQIPKSSLHRFARSARSSQLLALALLGSAAQRQPSLRWFWNAIETPEKFTARRCSSFAFEHFLKPEDLNEKPRVSQLDFVVRNAKSLAVVECKWSEPGLGICSCLREGEGNPRSGSYCAGRIEMRSTYWRVANQYFGLEPTRDPLFHCALSAGYQVIRNVAAAVHLAGSAKDAVFVLLFDQNNPYFRPTSNWPGWPQLLKRTFERHCQPRFHFRSVSWQEIIQRMPLEASVRRWAAEKHRLLLTSKSVIQTLDATTSDTTPP
jgi:hypothetical protein